MHPAPTRSTLEKEGSTVQSQSYSASVPSGNYPRGIGARYHRVSDSRQDLERQVGDIDRWLARGNLKASRVFEDQGGSRDKAEDRFQFQAMLGAVQARTLDWVVIQTIDRLGFKDAYE